MNDYSQLKPNYKFLNRLEVKGLGETLENHNNKFTEQKSEEFRSNNKDNFYAALISNDEVVFCSKLEINGKDLWIPEPNPVHIYFYNAYRLIPTLKKSQTEFESMADQLKGSSTMDTYPYLLKFLSNSTQFVFNSFSSIEAFINQQIPEDLSYTSKKKGLMNKQQAERGLYFKEKSTRLMKEIYSKDIVSEEPNVYSKVWELKELRDDLIHLKTQNDKYRNKYRLIINKLLNFKYLEILKSVEEYINFFEPKFIEHNKKAAI